MAREVRNPSQRSLGILDAVVERNAYGRQIDSSILTAETELAGGPLEMVFIRAPRIASVGEGVEILARRDGDPVLVRQRRCWRRLFTLNFPRIAGCMDSLFEIVTGKQDQ